MKHQTAILCLTMLLVAACGKQDVHTACYSNGDHENMSDGRIIRICDCITNAIEKEGATKEERLSIIAWFNKKKIETTTTQELEKSKGIIASITQLKTRCEAVK
ncbi:MAG: hypothetical protein WAO98_09365 [Alphaproteobacteria bacterium]